MSGPVCRVGGDRTLKVVLADGAADLSLTVDGQLVPGPTMGSHRSVAIAPGASSLDATARVAGVVTRFHMALGDEPTPPEWLENARKAHRAGHAAEALRLLAEGSAEAGDGFDAQVASFRARARLAAGQSAEAAEDLARSAEMHAARGELSLASDDESARVFVLVQLTRDFAAAHEALDRMKTWSRDYPEGEALALEERGALEVQTGDIAHGLQTFEEARALDQRSGLESLERDVEQEYAMALLGLGRFREARALLARLESESGPVLSPCDRAALQLNLGWAQIVLRDGEGGDAEGVSPEANEPVSPLTLAEEAYRGKCLDPQARANALLSLARAHLQTGELTDARALIAQTRPLVPQLDPLVSLFALDVQGRLALAAGDALGALRTYTTLATRAAGTSTGDEARAHEGRSEALSALGDPPGALAAIALAEGSVDDLARTVSLGDGRGAFFASRERIVRRHVKLLVDAGDAPRALDVARAARARRYADVQRAARAASLPPPLRARWEAALATWQTAHEGLVEDSRADWSLSKAALDRASVHRRGRDVELRATLDGLARELFPSAPLPTLPLASEDGAVALAFHPLDRGWWGAFRVERGEVKVDRVAASTDPARATEAAGVLLASQAEAVHRARRVRWLAFDALRDVDLHALPFEGEPLLTRVPVEYLVDVADPGRAASVSEGPALIVADPSGGLRGARREGEVLAKAERGSVFVAGARATRARVMAELPHARSFVFSGHAVEGGTDGWDSALLLANDERLSIADVLVLPSAPRSIVLAACDAGRNGARGEPSGLGLSEAFLSAGARSLVAPSRPIRDEDGERFVRALAPALAREPLDAAAAVRDAELALRHEAPTTDWSAFRAFTRP